MLLKIYLYFRAVSQLQEQIKCNFESKLLDEEKKIKEGELLIKKMKEEQQRDYQELKTQQLKKQTFRVTCLLK